MLLDECNKIKISLYGKKRGSSLVNVILIGTPIYFNYYFRILKEKIHSHLIFLKKNTIVLYYETVISIRSCLKMLKGRDPL